jgi:pre-mRNA-splicing factor ISY1
MYKLIDPDYYGYRDEDDGVLVKVEAPAEELAVAKAVQEWKSQKKQRTSMMRGSSAEGGNEEYDDDEEIDVRASLNFRSVNVF